MTGEGKRNREEGIRYTKPRKIIGKNRHVINGCWKSGGNERRAYRNSAEKYRKAHMYTAHIRIEGGGFCEKLEPRKSSFNACRC